MRQDKSSVRLVEMEEGDFRAYLEALQQRYAQSIAASWGVGMETAETFSSHQLATLLPEGRNTRFHSLRKICVQEIVVGEVWFSQQPVSAAYIYDIIIDSKQRRQGYASAAMAEVEAVVREAGCIALSLHVFAHNPEAQALYEKLGLSVIGLQFYKPFSQSV
ncbi:MAG: GNAT family N-acetyltransferase [bacterium]